MTKRYVKSEMLQRLPCGLYRSSTQKMTEGETEFHLVILQTFLHADMKNYVFTSWCAYSFRNTTEKYVFVRHHYPSAKNLTFQVSFGHSSLKKVTAIWASSVLFLQPWGKRKDRVWSTGQIPGLGQQHWLLREISRNPF